MAIRLVDVTPKCAQCGEDLFCINCRYEGADQLLPLTEGELSVLRDSLERIRELEKEKRIEMSATDHTDLDSLTRKLEKLEVL